MINCVLKLCAIVTLVVGFATKANASLQLIIGDSYYVGNIIKGALANPLSEVSYINTLTTLAIGQSNTTIGSQKYNRVGSTHVGPLAQHSQPARSRGTLGTNLPNGFNKINLGSQVFSYVLAKNGNTGSFVWYIMQPVLLVR